MTETNKAQFLDPKILKYDDLSGDMLVAETKRFLLAFPNSIECTGCHKKMKPENLSAINYHQTGSISFGCFECGTGFTIFLMGKFIRNYCITEAFTQLKTLERV